MQKMKYTFLSMLVYCMITPGLMAQIIHPTSGTTNVTVTCGPSTSYFDSGGSTGDYSNSESGTTVICPSVSGQVITLEFTHVNIETSFSSCFDQMTISDGNGTLFSRLLEKTVEVEIMQVPAPMT